MLHTVLLYSVCFNKKESRKTSEPEANPVGLSPAQASNFTSGI